MNEAKTSEGGATTEAPALAPVEAAGHAGPAEERTPPGSSVRNGYGPAETTGTSAGGMAASGERVATLAAPVEEPPDAPTERIGTFHSFRYREYRWLWIGNTFSSAAMWIQQTTMGWVAYDLTGSGALLGVINSLRNLPPLFAAPIAGVTADRYSRNTVVAVTQALLFVNAFMLAAALMLDTVHVWHLLLFTVIAGTLNAFNQPARQTMVFDVVPRSAAPNAIALNSVAGNATRTMGPMIGGALIVFFGPANNFFIQACSYLAVMATVFMIRKFPPRLSGRKRSFFGDMKEGYRWALNNPRARLLMLMMCMYPGFIIPVHSALMPIFAKEVYHEGPGGLGVLLSALGFGGLVGGFLTARLNMDNRGLLQLLGLFMCSGFVVLYGLAGHYTHNIWLGVFLLIMSAVGASLLNTTNQTVLQLFAPDRMRGRITGILNIQPVFSSVGILISGFGADVVGPVAVAISFGTVMFTAGLLILVFSPRMRDLRLSRLGEGND